jgi:hypothetical protein
VQVSLVASDNAIARRLLLWFECRCLTFRIQVLKLGSFLKSLWILLSSSPLAKVKQRQGTRWSHNARSQMCERFGKFDSGNATLDKLISSKERTEMVRSVLASTGRPQPYLEPTEQLLQPDLRRENPASGRAKRLRSAASDRCSTPAKVRATSRCDGSGRHETCGTRPFSRGRGGLGMAAAVECIVRRHDGMDRRNHHVRSAHVVAGTLSLPRGSHRTAKIADSMRREGIINR